MYKKTLTYTDYNDVEKTESFYFNLSKAEIVEKQLSVEGGFDKVLKGIVDSKNIPELTKFFKTLILASYGVKTEDGRFDKSEELRNKFEHSAAYSEILVEFITDTKAASDFVNGIIPKGIEVKNA